MNKMITPARRAATPLVRIPDGEYAKAAPRAIRAFGAPRADASKAGEILAELKASFDTMKAENDAALKKIDVVQTEKVDRISADIGRLQSAIDEINRRVAAQQLNGGYGDPTSPERVAYAKAFDGAFRRGSVTDAELHDLAVKAALTTQSNPDGGYLVAPEIEQAIDRVLMKVSAMRGLATVRSIGSSSYKKLIGQGGTQSGWVGEEEARTETGTPSLVEHEFPAMEIYAQPAATQSMLDDGYLDVASWLADEVNIEFAEQEGAAFINGNGVRRPRGILKYDTVADSSYAYGKLGYLVSGASSTISNGDAVVDLTYRIKKGYRQNATWLTNRGTLSKLRQLKDGQGNYLWQPSFQLGQPQSLAGYPVEDDDNMPDIAANAFPLAFGDFKRGYLIVDRAGIRVLRDPLTKKGWVLFYTTKRVGGGIQNFEAIKLLKIST